MPSNQMEADMIDWSGCPDVERSPGKVSASGSSSALAFSLTESQKSLLIAFVSPACKAAVSPAT